MNRRETALVLTATAVAASALGFGLKRWHDDAHRDYEQALGRLEETALDTARLRRLSARRGGQDCRRAEEASIIGLIQAALREAHLPVEGTIGNLQTRSNPIPDSPLRLQTAILTLVGLTPGDLGEWLTAWHRREHGWRMTECDLNRRRSGPGHRRRDPAAAVAGERYDVRIVLIAPYWEDAP